MRASDRPWASLEEGLADVLFDLGRSTTELVGLYTRPWSRGAHGSLGGQVHGPGLDRVPRVLFDLRVCRIFGAGSIWGSSFDEPDGGAPVGLFLGWTLFLPGLGRSHHLTEAGARGVVRTMVRREQVLLQEAANPSAAVERVVRRARGEGASS